MSIPSITDLYTELENTKDPRVLACILDHHEANPLDWEMLCGNSIPQEVCGISGSVKLWERLHGLWHDDTPNNAGWSQIIRWTQAPALYHDVLRHAWLHKQHDLSRHILTQTTTEEEWDAGSNAVWGWFPRLQAYMDKRALLDAVQPETSPKSLGKKM